MHGVSSKSPELKGFVGKKVTATRQAAYGKYAEIEQVLSTYEDMHFGHLDGAHRSQKPETAKKIKLKKLSSLRKCLRWAVDKINDSSIEAIVKNIKVLTRNETGYFDSLKTVSSAKGTLSNGLLVKKNLHIFLLVTR